MITFLTVDEKSKLITGKNGSQATPPINEMPSLDDEPELKEGKDQIVETKDEQSLENSEKAADGSNGKIISKDTVESKPEDPEPEKPSDENAPVDPPEPRWAETSDGQIEQEDSDDYLIYLEDILLRIHK